MVAVMKSARVALAQEQALQRIGDAPLELTYKEWPEQGREATLAEIMSSCGLRRFGDVLDALPSASSSVARAEAHASRSSNFGKTLQDDWTSKHRPIEHESCRPIPDHHVRASKCLLAGVCICGPGARHRSRCRLDLDRLLKRSTPKTSPNRDRLMEGKLFVQLRGAKLEEEDDPAWRQALADLGGEQGGPCESLEVRWHTGHQSLNPYQSTMRPMRFVG